MLKIERMDEKEGTLTTRCLTTICHRKPVQTLEDSGYRTEAYHQHGLNCRFGLVVLVFLKTLHFDQ